MFGRDRDGLLSVSERRSCSTVEWLRAKHRVDPSPSVAFPPRPAPPASHFQHHSADNIVQPSSATSVSSAAPRSETPDAVSTRGERRGSGTSATVDSRRQQSTLQDHHFFNHNKTISAAILPRPGRRPPEMSATIVEDDGDTPVSTATSSCVLRAGREELESEVDGALSARDAGQSEASNIAARSPSYSESRNGRVPGQPRQHLLSPGRARQDSVAGSRRVSVGGNISEDRAPEAAVIAPASRTAGAVTSRQTSASTTATEAVDEVGWPGNLLSQCAKIV